MKKVLKGKELLILVDRMIKRLVTDQFLEGFSDEQLTAVIDAVSQHGNTVTLKVGLSKRELGRLCARKSIFGRGAVIELNRSVM